MLLSELLLWIVASYEFQNFCHLNIYFHQISSIHVLGSFIFSWLFVTFFIQVFCLSFNLTSFSMRIVFYCISDSILIFSIFSAYMLRRSSYTSLIFSDSSDTSQSFSFSTRIICLFLSFSNCKVFSSFSSSFEFFSFGWLLFVALLPVFLLWYRHLCSCRSKLQFLISR